MAECLVTEEEIRVCEKRSQLMKLAKRFDPTMGFLEHVTSVDDIRTRLLLAVKRQDGLMKDIGSLTQLFEKVQENDSMERVRLKRYIKQTDKNFKNMGAGIHMLSLNADQVQDTSKHIQLLEDDKCPIVVAGEVSSGKSTLLNLFLGKVEGEHKLQLPTSTLSCTGRVCELTYGEKLHAKLRKTTGEVEDIKLDENLQTLKDTINMQDKTPDNFNKFDVVQIFLPIPFLKSGITLVDTPGIGVDDEDSSIVKEYVKNHNVFGFIFTIHASAGGGVNQKFQSLLQTLAGDEYLDNNGDRKLDPRSVVFCCNFWDEVPDKDKDATRALILKTIAGKPFLRGFEAAKQLFFMDSKQTYYTWQAGFITNEFDQFIDGMQEFFSKGKLKKLRFSYNYIENVLERSLHSLRSYLYWAKQQKRIGERKQQKMLQFLKAIKAKLRTQQEMLNTMIADQVSLLTEQVKTFLATKEVVNKICSWDKTSIYMLSTDVFSYEKSVFEYKLDAMIDERISEVLLEWELENLCIHHVQCTLGDAIFRTFTALGSSMDRFERGICSSNLLAEDDVGSVEDDIAMDEMANALHVATRKDFDIVFGKGYASSISDISSGPHMLLDFLKAKKSGQKSDNKGLLGRSDREVVKYMKERSLMVLDGLRMSVTAKELVDNQMNDMRKFLIKKYENLQSRIKQNETLVKNLRHLIDNAVGTTDWYQENTTNFRGILDKVLKFGVRIFSHKRAEVQIVHDDVDECFMPAGMYGSVYHAKLKRTRAMVTVKKTEGMFGDKLTEVDKNFIIKHLKGLKKSPYIPTFLGMDVRGDLVLDGKFVTIRNYFLQENQPPSRASYRQQICEFLLELGHALQYLHYQNLVHIEVCPDSVMVKVTDSKVRPLLSSLSERKELELLELDKHKTLELFYLPPEVLAGPVGDNSTSHWYEFPGDMYGLGLVIVELWCQTQDLFQEVRNTPIKEWRTQQNPGTILLEQARVSGMKFPKDLKMTVKQLLRKDPEERMTAREFVSKWQELCTMMSHYEEEDDLSMCSMDKDEGDSPPKLRPHTHQPKRLLSVEDVPRSPTLSMAPNIPRDKTFKELAGQLDYKNLREKRSSTSIKRRDFASRTSQSVDEPDEPEEDDTLPSFPSQEELRPEVQELEVPVVTEPRSSRTRDRIMKARMKNNSLEALTKTQGRKFDDLIGSLPDHAHYTRGTNVVNILSAQSKGRIYDSSSGLPGSSTSSYQQSEVRLDKANLDKGIFWREMSEVKGSGILADLDTAEQRQQEALFEIISSELTYRKSLDHLVNTSIGEMENKFKIKKGTIEHNHLFSNVCKICEVSSRLCNIWEGLWCSSVVLDCTEICNTLNQFFTHKENRMAYILYYKNVIYQQRMCSQLNNQNEEFRRYTRDLGINKLSLYDGYLALPFQRIPRYRILVEAVIKSLPGEDVSGPEYHAIQECLDTILTFVAQCNNAVKKMEDLENMIALEKKLDFDSFKKVAMVSEHRAFVKKGVVRRLTTGQHLLQKAFSGATQSWEIHLFSDLVIMAQVKKHDVLQVKCYCKPTQVYAENVDKAKAEEMLECSSIPSGCNFMLKVSFLPTGDDVAGITKDWFLLACPTSESQLRWIEALSPEMPDKSIDYSKIINYSQAECPVVQVIHSYRAQHGDELTIYEGEILKILRKMTDCDWFEGEKLSSGERGWFPGKLAVEIDNPTDRKGIIRETNKVMQMTMHFKETNPHLQKQLHSLKELQLLEV